MSEKKVKPFKINEHPLKKDVNKKISDIINKKKLLSDEKKDELNELLEKKANSDTEIEITEPARKSIDPESEPNSNNEDKEENSQSEYNEEDNEENASNEEHEDSTEYRPYPYSYSYFSANYLDIDNMTYEQLLALEENIGKVSKGLTDIQIQVFILLPLVNSYSTIRSNS